MEDSRAGVGLLACIAALIPLLVKRKLLEEKRQQAHPEKGAVLPKLGSVTEQDVSGGEDDQHDDAALQRQSTPTRETRDHAPSERSTHHHDRDPASLSSSLRGVPRSTEDADLVVEPDYRYWDAKARFDAEDRLAQMQRPTQLINVAESEPNDTLGSATPVPGFGTGMGQESSASLTGTISSPPAPGPLMSDMEDNGQISLATDTGLTLGSSVKVIGDTIGDGPHGSGGSGSGDFDFYAIVATAAGQTITADVDTISPFGALDPFVALYNSAGTLVGFNYDDGATFDSFLSVAVAAADTYYLAVSGYVTFNGNFIDDPERSGQCDPGSGGDRDALHRRRRRRLHGSLCGRGRGLPSTHGDRRPAGSVHRFRWCPGRPIDIW